MSNFDASNDSVILRYFLKIKSFNILIKIIKKICRKAMKGFGTDEAALIK